MVNLLDPFDRLWVVRKAHELDPDKDHQEIVRLVSAWDWPWLLKKSLEFALFRTYAVPHTSRVLVATGEFASHGQKRYDDTTLMIAGLAQCGYDSEFGQKVIERMNLLHGSYNLQNRDMLYVLSVFVLEPIRWAENYGYRQPTEHENQALFRFWQEVGQRMHIADIPDTLAELDRFNREHEAKYFRYDDANHEIAEATMSIFLNWFPAPLRPLIRPFLLGFMDDDLLNAMGLEKPHAIFRWASRGGLWLVGRVMRFVPPRRKPYDYLAMPNRTYGSGGVRAEDLGATPNERVAVQRQRPHEQATG